MCQDQYGNYVIQHILENNKGQKCEEIFKALRGRVYEMSIHKFSSNVIEKCLHFGKNKERNHLIDEVLLREDKMQNSLVSLVKDKFGNYVIQKMIEYSEKDKRNEIINKILSSSSINVKDGYTKHVLNYIEKLGYNINKNINNNTNIDLNLISNINNVSMENNKLLNLNENAKDFKRNKKDKFKDQNENPNNNF